MRFRKRITYSDTVTIYPEGSIKGFLIDRRFIKKVRRVNWLYIPGKQRARGFFGKGKTRLYLHRYVLQLAGKYYPEVTFANGNYWDCRLANLKPYRRDEEGATRRLFRNSTTKLKGVCRQNGKWVAMIRVKSVLKHLGTFDDPELAAVAYKKAWDIAHPDL